jgi:hypothetical protein
VPRELETQIFFFRPLFFLLSFFPWARIFYPDTMTWSYSELQQQKSYRPQLKSQLYYIEKYAGLPGILALCAVIELLIKEAESGVPCLLDDDEVVLNRCLTRW